MKNDFRDFWVKMADWAYPETLLSAPIVCNWSKQRKWFFLNFTSELVRKQLIVIKICRHEKVGPDIDCHQNINAYGGTDPLAPSWEPGAYKISLYLLQW